MERRTALPAIFQTKQNAVIALQIVLFQSYMITVQNLQILKLMGAHPLVEEVIVVGEVQAEDQPQFPGTP